MRTFSRNLLAVLAVFAAFTFGQELTAQVFDGPGIMGGLNAAAGLSGVSNGDVRGTATLILIRILAFLALVATITVVIAGIWLIVGLGSDDSKEKAKKIILYTLIGLAIVLFSRIIVEIITVYLYQTVR